MAFSLIALISLMGKSEQPKTIIVSTFGVWKQELTNFGAPDESLNDLRTKFKLMDETYKGKKKPLTLSWKPPEKENLYFSQQKNKKLNILFYIEKYDDKSTHWKLSFENVELNGSPKTEYRRFKSMKEDTKLERVDFTFLTFKDIPDSKI